MASEKQGENVLNQMKTENEDAKPTLEQLPQNQKSSINAKDEDEEQCLKSSCVNNSNDENSPQDGKSSGKSARDDEDKLQRSENSNNGPNNGNEDTSLETPQNAKGFMSTGNEEELQRSKSSYTPTPDTNEENWPQDVKSSAVSVRNDDEEELPQSSRSSCINHPRLLGLRKQKSRVRVLLHEDSVQMFLSTDQMEKEEAYQKERMIPRRLPALTRQYSETTKRRHEQIIRHILEDFDLEDCMDRYRNLHAYTRRPQGKSIADFRFRSELIRLMGTEIIRVSDKTFSGRFQQRLREDYERMLVEKEVALGRVEKDRVHRLYMESVIGETAAAFTRDIKSKVTCTVYKAKRGSLSVYPMFKREEYNRKEREIHHRRMKRIYSCGQMDFEKMVQYVRSELAPPPSVYVELDDGAEKEEEEAGKEQTADPAALQALPQNKSQVAFAGDNDYSYSTTNIQVQVQAHHVSSSALKLFSPEEKLARRRKRYRHLPEGVRQLYEEETVAGLYALASRLVRTKKQPAAPKEVPVAAE